MRIVLISVLGSAVLVGFGGCGSAGAGPGAVRSDPAHTAAVRAANDRLEALYESADYAGVAAMYEDDAVLLGPGGYRVAGREAIDAYWQPGADRPAATDPEWDLAVHRVEGVESLLVQRGRSRLSRVVHGARRESVVEFYVIWRRQEDGSYRIAVDAYWPTGQ